MFDRLKRLFSKARPQSSNTHCSKVGGNDSGMWVRWSDGHTSQIPWSEVIGVAIETNDRGPFEEDVLWVVATSGTAAVIMFANSTPGVVQLLPRLQALSGFDNEAMFNAMCCAENRVFILWDHEGRHLTDCTKPFK